jgi:hypothetical protein
VTKASLRLTFVAPAAGGQAEHALLGRGLVVRGVHRLAVKAGALRPLELFENRVEILMMTDQS